MPLRWDPQHYLKFADHRMRPALDLLAQINVQQAKLVYDLGCGPGNVTRMLAERWGGAELFGVDNSSEMLAQASKQPSKIRWVQGDITAWAAATPPDVIFSNAALHWLDDHQGLFPKLFAQLSPGGVLAVQMPTNHEAPSHVLLGELARHGPWRDLLAPLVRQRPVGSAEFYYDLLASQASALDIWETRYAHILEGDSPVLQWVRGTALKPFLDALEMAGKADWRAEFEAQYSQQLDQAYPRQADGRTVFAFRRLFLIAVN